MIFSKLMIAWNLRDRLLEEDGADATMGVGPSSIAANPKAKPKADPKPKKEKTWRSLGQEVGAVPKPT